MSVYSVKRRGWRYDFTLNGVRHTGPDSKPKRGATSRDTKKGGDTKPEPPEQDQEALIPTDMVFLDLVNARLDYVKAYNSEEHYRSYLYLGRRWTSKWGELMVSEITTEMVQKHLFERRKISAYTANKDLRYFRATINFGH